MWHLKTTTAPVIVGALGMIKKGTDEHINMIHGNPSRCERQKKMPFVKLLISLGEYHQCDWKITPKIDSKKKHYNIEYI